MKKNLGWSWNDVLLAAAVYWVIFELGKPKAEPKGDLEFPPDTPPPSSPDEWANPYGGY